MDGSIVRKTGTLHKVMQSGAILNKIVLNAGLETMTPKMTIPMTNNLHKKLAWNSKIILHPQ